MSLHHLYISHNTPVIFKYISYYLLRHHRKYLWISDTIFSLPSKTSQQMFPTFTYTSPPWSRYVRKISTFNGCVRRRYATYLINLSVPDMPFLFTVFHYFQFLNYFQLFLNIFSTFLMSSFVCLSSPLHQLTHPTKSL